MNTTVKTKFSIIIIFMSIFSLLFAYIISTEVIEKTMSNQFINRNNQKTQYFINNLNEIKKNIENEIVGIAKSPNIFKFFDKNNHDKQLDRKNSYELKSGIIKKFLYSIPYAEVVTLDIIKIDDLKDNRKNAILKNPSKIINRYAVDKHRRVFIEIVVPIILKNRVEGVIFLKTYIDRVFLNKLKMLIGAEILIADPNNIVIASTFLNNIAELNINKNNTIVVNELPYHIDKHQIRIMDGEYSIILAYDESDLMLSKKEISNRIFIALFFIFVILFLISEVIVSIFLESLKELMNKLYSIRMGEMDIDFNNLKNKKDEVGKIAHGVDIILNEIANKNRAIHELTRENKNLLNKSEKINSEFQKTQNKLIENNKNMHRMNKTLSNRILEITNMYRFILEVSKHITNERVYDALMKGIKYNLRLTKVAYYNAKNGKLHYKIGSGTGSIPKYFDLKGKSEKLFNSYYFNLKELFDINIKHFYAFPIIINKNNKKHIFGMMFLSNDGIMDREFIQSILTYIRVVALMLENRDLYLTLLKENKKLEETTLQLQEAEKLKNNFIANVSHELKVPLTTIKGFNEYYFLSNKKNLDKTAKEGFNISLSNIERLQMMIDNLLVYSRFEKGEMRSYNQLINLYDIIDSSLMSLEGILKKNSVELHRKMKKSLMVEVDEHLLRQVFINIISNSVKFAKGDIKIRIIIEELKNRYLVRIKDNGVGMEKSKIEQILKGFRQLDEGITRSYSGIGIGLTITNKILECYGERVYINSILNEGTEVYFFINKAED